jgi:MotA/TolQ/ExbB proton channel family
MGNSLLAVVSTRRPGQDSVSANAELVRWTGIRLVGPPELGPEALLATAMGLIAAIPAVVMYINNGFARAITSYSAQLGDI